MKDYIEKRAVELAQYIVENNATVRKTAKIFNISKSTVSVMLGDGLLNLHTDFFIIFANTIDKSTHFVIQCNTRKEVFHMTISLRLNDEDTLLIKKYAELNKMSVSELIRQTVMERIENEYDLELFNKAINEYKDDPVTYSLDEVEKELGLL